MEIADLPYESDIMQMDVNDDGSITSHGRNGSPSSPHPKRFPKSSSRPPKPKNVSHPLQTGIRNYLNNHYRNHSHTQQSFLSSQPLSSLPLPKRFTVYPPLLLLPSNAFSTPAEWAALYNSLSSDQRQELYACIAASFASMGVTHVAMNAPIAPTMTKVAGVMRSETQMENRIRSPTGLVPLYGDFGDGEDVATREVNEEEKEANPTEEALRSALWVHSVQNRGIVQIWAPLHSMFSRGNVVEKARILGIESRFEGLDDGDVGDELEGGNGRRRLLGQKIEDVAVVDMYAGIGYFVFSYLKRGVGRVWGWEINGWSIEGLCRACRENGWGVKVVKIDKETGEVEGGIDVLVEGLRKENRVVVFHGDNQSAGKVMWDLKEALQRKGRWKRIRHVSLGLLPSSKRAWEGAARVLDTEAGGWIHVHENVNVNDIEMMEAQIVEGFNSLLISTRGDGKLLSSSAYSGISTAECIHVERVKTYAPGVMHCVFDIYIPPSAGWLDKDKI
ncbi:tRNA(Phe) (4-demethylwyosine(37)-C(7)) aminocarboxypropyltransferase [Paracoccidioides brasiliensis Pb18]|uniref:tRNA wybutosine-synthesizing protein 2 n=1 Tax=Paracoccidioides brasiliensis (strain Pb18) TaxID=502780 RepID=C1GE62_PARBD|nr:tRNA(Phe) (4-demethylwyosine(37)-C(7)) aminocarboxypropyltransferase [Paracoccidioides brasiliensis Pb18]EEH49469.2 hypothetical protein PADG_05548 [Paracoccidioides brasiliensis Pb18]